MLQNYFKTALRHLFRQPQYAILNILGLTIGLASSFLILLYLFHELSFDKYHEKADRIYRVSAAIQEPDNAFRWAQTQTPLANTLKNEFAEVEEYVRFVLNKTVADRIFKGANPIGKTLKSDGDQSFQVTGIYQDMPTNSHLIANVMISATTDTTLRRTGAEGGGSWGGFGVYNYVLLKENASPKQFESKLGEIIKKYVATIFDELGIKVKYVLIPMTRIHLHSNFENEPEPLGNINYIYIFRIYFIDSYCIDFQHFTTFGGHSSHQ